MSFKCSYRTHTKCVPWVYYFVFLFHLKTFCTTSTTGTLALPFWAIGHLPRILVLVSSSLCPLEHPLEQPAHPSPALDWPVELAGTYGGVPPELGDPGTTVPSRGPALPRTELQLWCFPWAAIPGEPFLGASLLKIMKLPFIPHTPPLEHHHWNDEGPTLARKTITLKGWPMLVVYVRPWNRNRVDCRTRFQLRRSGHRPDHQILVAFLEEQDCAESSLQQRYGTLNSETKRLE